MELGGYTSNSFKVCNPLLLAPSSRIHVAGEVIVVATPAVSCGAGGMLIESFTPGWVRDKLFFITESLEVTTPCEDCAPGNHDFFIDGIAVVGGVLAVTVRGALVVWMNSTHPDILREASGKKIYIHNNCVCLDSKKYDGGGLVPVEVPDGRRVFSSEKTPVMGTETDDGIEFTSEGKKISSLPPTTVISVPGSGLVASVGDGLVKFFDPASGKEVRKQGFSLPVGPGSRFYWSEEGVIYFFDGKWYWEGELIPTTSTYGVLSWKGKLHLLYGTRFGLWATPVPGLDAWTEEALVGLLENDETQRSQDSDNDDDRSDDDGEDD